MREVFQLFIKFAVKKLREFIVESCKNVYTVIMGLYANNLYEGKTGKC